jgi:hypothetical protein
VEVKPDGPVHDHAVALLELAERVTVPPAHIGPLLVAPVDDGAGLIVTVALPWVPQHEAVDVRALK